MDISIRKAEPSDAEGIWKCYTAPQAVRNTLQLPYRNLESVRDLLNKSGEGDHILVAIIDGEVVGVIGLHTSLRPRVNHRAEIGMMVRDDWQGKGVGTAMMQAVIDLADRWLNLTRIELTVFTDNEPAIALYRKFGFEIEGARFASMRSAMESSWTLTRWRESNEHCSWIRIASSMQSRGKARRSEAYAHDVSACL
jgi:putative acetyltransferase